MTIRLPRALYERLRREAFETHTSQAAIITETLTDRYERIDGIEAHPGVSTENDQLRGPV